MRVNLIWGGPGAKSAKVTEMRQHFPPWNYWRFHKRAFFLRLFGSR
jgi:hypothetical protein